jgi:AGZA family xanthine/uracil permease-like MFS transporter
MSAERPFHYPLWCRGDLDGFFGLMVDNLVQVLVIVALSTSLAGLPPEMVYQRILPGVAVSLLIGNLFYGLQAQVAARRQRNANCTALPYGINTPSVIAFVVFVMAPVYHEQIAGLTEETPAELAASIKAAAAELAWLAGVAACLVSGLVEFGGAFVAERLRRATPRAALLGVLAAVGITFIASDFAFQIYARPLIGVLPMGILLLAYFAHYQFPLRLPGGFVAILVGTLIAWGMTASGLTHFGGSSALAWSNVTAATQEIGWIAPQFYGDALQRLVTDQGLLLRFLAVSIPMGLLNLLGALQNIESAEAGGDRFATAPSLAVNGIGSIAAGLFGSCFPTTIYIGHPGWKALGARSGYSILNGLFFTACFLFGLGPLLAALIPIEAGAAIVMYIGIIITAQAFQATPQRHAPAVAIALFPALAAMLVYKMMTFLREAHAEHTFAYLVQNPNDETSILAGLLALTGANSGWILVTLLITALATALIDHKYIAAAIWSGIAAVLTALGLIHAYALDAFNALHELFIWQAPTDDLLYVYRPWPIAIGYAAMTLVFAAAAVRQRQRASLVPQRLDGVEPRSLERRVEPTEEPDGGRGGEGDDDHR